MIKKLSVLLVLVVCFSFVFAASVDTTSNISPAFVRNASRNTDTTEESAIYNIPGMAFADDGLYFNFGNQFVIKKYTHKVLSSKILTPGTKYSDDTPVFFFPDFIAMYKKDKLSGSVTFQIAGGGGKLDFDNGVGSINSLITYRRYSHLLPVKFKANSTVYSETAALSYKPIDWLSFAAGIRVLEGSMEMNLKSSFFGTAGFKANGVGIGGIFGVHAKPIDNLDLSLQYYTKVNLKMKIKDAESIEKLNLITVNNYYYDSPARLAFGVGYRVIEPLYLSAGFDYVWGADARYGSPIAGNSDYKNTFSIRAGVDYSFTDKLTASLGYFYDSDPSTDTINCEYSGSAVNHLVMGGVEYKFNKQFKAQIGVMYNFFVSKNYTDNFGNTYKLEKTSPIAAIGITYKPL